MGCFPRPDDGRHLQPLETHNGTEHTHRQRQADHAFCVPHGGAVMNHQRYAIDGDWMGQVGFDHVDEETGDIIVVMHETANLRDRRTNNVYADGAHRVTFNGKTYPGKGSRSPFIGETAWSHAEGYYRDLHTASRHGHKNLKEVRPAR